MPTTSGAKVIIVAFLTAGSATERKTVKTAATKPSSFAVKTQQVILISYYVLTSLIE